MQQLVRLRSLPLAALLLLALLCPPAASAAAGTGLPATVRPLDLINAIGEAKGRVVLLNFWATWCAPCRVEVPELMNLRSSYSDNQLVVLGVSMDENQASLDAFLNRLPLNYPVGRATDDVARMFRVATIPKLMVYDRQGALVHIREGVTSGQDLRQMVDALLAK